MIKNVVFAIAISIASLSACSPYSAAEDSVKRLLNDPESARFTEMRSGKQKGDVCGYVNAKNRMGGYAGEAPFFYQAQSTAVGILQDAGEREFESLWNRINHSSSFEQEYTELWAKCKNADSWLEVCGTPPPVERHMLCDKFTDAKSFYEAMRSKFQ